MSRFAQAEQLADLKWIATTIGGAIRRCRRSGLDPQSYAGLVGAAVVLSSPGATSALTATLSRIAAKPWRDDNELLRHVLELEVWLSTRLNEISRFTASVEADLAKAIEVFETTDDEDEEDEAWRTICDCRAALEVVEPAVPRLRHALIRVRAVPEELGEHYTAAYRTLSRGHVLPFEGRWFTGEPAPGIPTLPSVRRV